LRISAAILLVICAYSGAANAHAGGGGGYEPMPGISYTDMPPYHPMPICWVKRSCAYLRGHRRVYGR
jgi:hypothetical protein